MLPIEIALVGCHNATELAGRCATVFPKQYIDEYIIPVVEGMSAVQAYPIIESELPVRFVDVLDNMPDVWINHPTRPCTVTFQSRLNDRVLCTLYNVSPETFTELAQDMVSSTLWYLNSVEEN